MIKKKTNQNKVIALVMAIVLTFIMLVTMSFAYFTDKTDASSDNIQFGILELDPINNFTLKNEVNVSSPIVPGCELRLSGTIKLSDASNVDALLRVKPSLNVTPASGKTILESDETTLLTAVYNSFDATTDVWKSKAEDKYIYYLERLTPESEYNLANVDAITVPTSFGNEWQNATISLSLTLEVIQAEHVLPVDFDFEASSAEQIFNAITAVSAQPAWDAVASGAVTPTPEFDGVAFEELTPEQQAKLGFIENGAEYSIFVKADATGDVVIPCTYNGLPVTTIEVDPDYDWENPREITSVSIPHSVNTIGEYAFYSCTALESINIPNSVENIGDYAFYDCYSLNYNISNGVKYLGNDENPYLALVGVENTESTTYTIKEGTKFIYCEAFLDCASLTNITIPNTVTNIGDDAFDGCSNLASVTFESGSQLEIIGYNAFYGCSSLESITIPNTVTSIGNYAFYGCSRLTSVTIPSGVTSIGTSTFYGCSSLESITIPNTVTSIGNQAFSNCSTLASITLPNTITSIGTYTFYGCSSLTSITIPSGVTSIGASAFKQCHFLESINLPNSLTSIENSAFENCSSLATINYCGSEAQWNAITKSIYWNAGTPVSLVINYNYVG